MRNIYPLFEQNRILKKELLWSLRDYSFTHIQLEYQEYGQGIIRGCEVKVIGDQLSIGPGIIKHGQFICLLMEEERIQYKQCEKMQYLKATVEIDRTSSDYIAYRLELSLDFNEAQKEHEYELCRFNLRAGAELRDRYKSIYDMETEYDTVNLIYASWSALGGNAMSPSITRYFAQTVLASENSQPEDCSFASLCLCQAGAVPVSVLAGYINQRTKGYLNSETERLEFYKAMCFIIREIERGGQKREQNKKGRHQILVD